MALHNRLHDHSFKDVQNPVGLESLCGELNRTGQSQLERIMTLKDKLAPRPGSMILIDARKLAIELNGLGAVLFTAVDAATFLQVAQLYVTMTTAAAVSFVEYVSKSFPFPIQRVKSRDERPFQRAAGDQNHRDFTSLLDEKGYEHSPISTSAEASLYTVIAKTVFGGISEGSLIGSSEGNLQRELNHFLFFHNNYRSVPWLGGRTPLQKLVGFKEYNWMHSFDPSEKSDRSGFGAVGT